jgi:uncharacterized pyridoxamine 5'-phosphate oxidase family protein
MQETEEDIRALQELIDRTTSRMNPHMAGIVKPERRLTARQVVAYLQGIKHVAFATVNEKGEPRVAPLDGIFLRGRFHVSTGGAAARLGDLRRSPRCSLTHFSGDDVAVTVNGTAEIMGRDHPEIPSIEPVYFELYESSPFSWGEGVVIIRVEPTSMWTFAFHPERFPDPSGSQS